jgi:DNA-binding response OmpR family regulator
MIVLVERYREQGASSYGNALQKRYHVISVSSGKQALAHHAQANAIVLDAISLRTPGERIARQLKAGMPTVPLVHLYPDDKAAADKPARSKALHESPADVVLLLPFTARKLINALERLLQRADDRHQDELIACGTVAMNVTRRVLLVNGQETPLTPKLASLVEAFLRHPGETLDRKWLMAQVWQTDYLGDTRTLDVHVRWFRRLIEPVLNAELKTVRGVGYRLDLDEHAEPLLVPEALALEKV